jgi:sec-independent protein translocase protein TatA
MKPGIQELIIILLIVVVVFGPTQIPKLTKMFGQSIKGFREGMASNEDGDKKDDKSGDEEV